MLALRWGVALWAALVYGLSGYVLSISDNVNYVAGVALGPVRLGGATARHAHCFSAERRRECHLSSPSDPGRRCFFDAYGLIATGLLLIVAHYWQTVGFKLARLRGENLVPLWLMLAAVALGLGLTAVQILPTAELARISVRSAGLDYLELSKWSFPPPRLLELAQPYLFGSNYPTLDFMRPDFYPAFEGPWVGSVYVGTLTVALALVGMWRARGLDVIWIALLLGAIALSFGSNVAYHRYLVELIPGLDTQRYPEKFTFWVTLGIVVLAAKGTNAILDAEHRWLPPFANSRTKRLVLTVVLGLGMFLLLVDLPARTWIWEYARYESRFWSTRLPGRVTHLQGLLLHTAGMTLVLVISLWTPRERIKLTTAFVMLFTLGDLFWIHHEWPPLAPRELLTRSTPPQTIQKAGLHGSFRVYFDQREPGDDIAYADGVIASQVLGSLSGGRDPVLQGYAHLYAAVFRAERLQMNSGVVHGLRYLNGQYSPLQPFTHRAMEDRLLNENPHFLMRLMNVRWVLSSVQPLNATWDAEGFTETFRDAERNLRVVEVADPLGSALVVPNVVFVEPRTTRLLDAVIGLDDPRAQVVLASHEAATAKADETVHGSTILQFTRSTPEHIRIRGDSPYDRAYLLINESYHRGWEAHVNDEPAPTSRANLRMLAVPVPRGEWEVEAAIPHPAPRARRRSIWAGARCAGRGADRAQTSSRPGRGSLLRLPRHRRRRSSCRRCVES